MTTPSERNSGHARVTTGQTDAGTFWEIGNDRVRLRLVWSEERGLTLAALAGPGGPTLDGTDDALPFALTWNGSAPAGPGRLLGGAEERADGQATLALRLRFDPLTVTLKIRCDDGLPVVRQWLEIATDTTGRLAGVRPLALAVAASATATLTTIDGIQAQGGGRPKSGVYRAFRRVDRTLDEAVTLASGVRSTWDGTPWFALRFPDLAGQPGLVGGLEYSARWRLEVAPSERDSGARVAIGPDGLETELTPGQRWVSPPGFVGFFTGEIDAAVATQYDFHRGALAPTLPEDFPWVQYNTWYAYSCDIDAAPLLAEARIAAELGAEVYYVDAGWWEGHPQGRVGGFSTGLGTWTENRAKFPQGLAAFCDEIRALGMHAGLWVEPERVDLRTATTATWRTEWLATNSGRYIRADWPDDTDTAWLCFGSPEVQAWATDWISRLVERLGLRWLKWDSNYWGVCDRAGHGHGPGDGEAAQVAGVHAVLATLRARFPDLIIENCAGGGTRLDFALAAGTHVAWVSDASDPAHRVRFHLYGTSHLFPPAMLNSWLVESPFEDLDGREQPEAVLRAMVRGRMLGAFGLSCRLTSWTETTRRVVREEIAAYKADRHLLRDGYVSHLLPQPVLICPDLATPDVWEAYQFRAADAGETLVLVFRNAAADDEITLPLRGLLPDATYAISDEAGERGTATGADLMTTGLPVRLAPLTSGRYRLRRRLT